ncbi:alpha/beta hydrolase [Marinobacter confluentis]|uniref:Alpha/beta hydrolase n=1 Tax=Marinobacter confluentis TaxID=1697557 RepID=A0A4Z1C5Y9_9GAMM|nr:alpha/beta hydrolase [Marinobacter confluentis]TGN38715.1 alpha/beta hydrolase [Marinobacter confluentis]
MNAQERFITSPDGHQIPLLCWVPGTDSAEPASRVLIIAHGMAEHAARYQPLALWLNQRGVAVYAIQHRGHGPHCPPEQRGHYADEDGWQKVIDDLAQAVQHLRSEHPGLPLSLFGHSMGSFISQAYAQQYGNDIDNLLLCATNRIDRLKLSPYLGLVRLIKRSRGKHHRSPLIDRLSFDAFNRQFAPNRTGHDWLSRDAGQVDRYEADPLCGFTCTVGLWNDFIGGMLSLNPDQWRKDLPVHLMAGDQDPVGEMGKGFKRHIANLRKAGVCVASERLFEGARHELVNETVADQVWQHVYQCLVYSKP